MVDGLSVCLVVHNSQGLITSKLKLNHMVSEVYRAKQEAGELLQSATTRDSYGKTDVKQYKTLICPLY